jgi:hypothetical protein
MSAAPAVAHRLHLQLPESWVVMDPAAWDHTEEIARTAGLAASPAGVTDVSRPDLVATFFNPVTLSGVPIEIVIASLVAWSYASDSLPADAAALDGGTVLRGIETSPGVRADYYVLTLPVVSQDGAVTSLLTFSTPNLPLTKPMDEAFRSIWATASVDAIGDQPDPTSTPDIAGA